MAGNLIENQWKDNLKVRFPQFFNGVKVLDIGSANINGTNRPWFADCDYIGIDVMEYDNVDVVAVAHRYKAPKESFDVVLSTSQLEHDMHWRKTLKKMVKLLKPGGLMIVVACADTGSHGTRDSAPKDSLTSRLKGKWADYYQDVKIEMIRSVLDLEDIFEQHEIFYTPEDGNKHLHFWGIKK